MASTAEVPAQHAGDGDHAAVATGPRVGVRWKLLGAFAGAFTIVFVLIALWVVQRATANAMDRVTGQLGAMAVGGGQILDADAMATLVATVPAVPDEANATGLGYPDSELYRDLAGQLRDLTQIVPSSEPYTYFRDPADGQLYFAVSAGYYADPQYGVTYRLPVADVADEESATRMARGLEQLTLEPPYSDSFGDWVSAYSPIRRDDGSVVGAIGVDYPLDYVNEVQREAVRDVVPAMLTAYVLLLLLVLVVSTAVVRPLRRLTHATSRIAEGEYDLHVSDLVRSRFPDELYELGQSFEAMASKVAARERSLTTEVQRLRVEIDSVKREQSVAEITETDFFSDLAAKAADLRARMHDHDDGDAGAGGPGGPGNPADNNPRG